MDKIMKIVFSNLAICCYEAAVLGFLVVYYIRLKKEKKKAVEMNTLQKEKAREEKLDQVLRNRLYQGDGDKAFQNNIPYEISFHEEIENHGGTNENIAVQIIEKGKLSTRKYVIFISDMITIGRSGENALVLNDLKIAKEQCRIFCHEQCLYIQTLEDTHPVHIQRKRNVMQLGKDAVKLLDNDTIKLGETTLNIHFI